MAVTGLTLKAGWRVYSFDHRPHQPRVDDSGPWRWPVRTLRLSCARGMGRPHASRRPPRPAGKVVLGKRPS